MYRDAVSTRGDRIRGRKKPLHPPLSSVTQKKGWIHRHDKL
jgi:hypothetical protein